MRRSVIPLSAVVLLCAGCSWGRAADEPKRSAKAAASAPAVDHGTTVRAAVAATGKTSARIDEQIKIGDGTRTYTLSVKGSFDLAGDKGRLAVDMLDAPGPRHVDEVFTNGTVYVGGFLGMEDSWDSTARDEAEAHYLLRAPLNDPEHVLRQAAGMRKVSKVGEEKVNGAPAVHYRGILEDDMVTLRLAQDMRAQWAAGKKQIGEIPVFADVWVDRNGRAARTLLSCAMGPVSVTVTMNLADFGKPVEAVAPDPDKVTPVPSSGGVLTG